MKVKFRTVAGESQQSNAECILTDVSQSSNEPAATGIAAVPVTSRLSTKILAMTVVFVMLAEILIFVPSVTNMRLAWLRDRLNTAAAAAIVIDGLPQVDLPRPLQESTLMATGTMAIALHKQDITRMIVVSEMPPMVNAQYDLSETGFWAAARDAFHTLIFGGNDVFSVRGRIGESEMEIELVMQDAELRHAMFVYCREILLVSIIISLITAALIFFAINRILIRPVSRMTASMQAFAADPSNASAVMAAPRGSDELAFAARHLALMQRDLQKTIRQQKNLADLGLAVSKINHDMRNILSSAQLMSDRLADIDDNVVRGLSTKLVRTLGRAIGYSTEVLSYGRASETAPRRSMVLLSPLIEDVGEILGLGGTDIEFVVTVDRKLAVDADPEQLFRVIYNLCRNSSQALEGQTEQPRRLEISAERQGHLVLINVDDTGPGMPQKAKDNLFAAFRGSARSGGTGLGLAIARELIEAHGGSIRLVEKATRGTCFCLVIPDSRVL
ncbi:sensor histidine kinase [Rhizobium alvei]|uniref:sensor histidine kinase n=1 Tax=Rhizobium alvei TaxID=1132659 RepID=UPI00360E9C6D